MCGVQEEPGGGCAVQPVELLVLLAAALRGAPRGAGRCVRSSLFAEATRVVFAGLFTGLIHDGHAGLGSFRIFLVKARAIFFAKLVGCRET